VYYSQSTLQGGSRLDSPRRPAPLVSIIAVVFQSFVELRALLDSFRSCDLSDAEIIVIDGGSTDGSIDLLQASNDLIGFWMSEPDQGIYDAMNKGIQAAHGTYILHLNAGDTLLHLPLNALRQCLKDRIDVASFSVLDDNVRVFHPRSGLRNRIENTWHHQGTFYRREAHLLYDPSYRVYGDFDLNQRMLLAGCSVRFFSEIVASHSTGGISSALTINSAHRREIWRTVSRNSGLLYVPIAFLKLHLYILLHRFRAFRKNTDIT
jgi:GT2 family glycosyltransferase